MSTAPDKAPALRALILKGGGVKGLALAGSLRVLERHLAFDLFVGTSAGAIAAVLLAAGYTGAELAAILERKDFRELVSDSWPRRLWGTLARGGPFSGEPIRSWIRSLLRERDPHSTRLTDFLMRDLPKRAIVFASKRPQGTVVFDSQGDHDDTPADLAVRYSMSIPFVFQPLKLDEDRVYDGGLLSNFPLETFLELLPNVEFVALYLTGSMPSDRKRTSIFGDLWSILLDRTEPKIVDEHRDNVLVLNPDPIRTTQFGLTPLDKEFLLAEGEAAAVRFLARRKPSLATEAEATAAQERSEGLRAKVKAAVAERRRRRAIWAGFAALAAILVLSPWISRRLDSKKGEPPPAVGPATSGTPSNPAGTAMTTEASPQPEEHPQPPPFGIDAATLSERDLRRYAGQLFLVGYESRFAGDRSRPADGLAAARVLVARQGVGGVILFNGNAPPAVSPPEKRRRFIALTDELQSMAKAREPGLPLIVATDQEGGSTQALPGLLVTTMPAAMALGGLRQPKRVEEVARMIGEELRLLGVNVNLAPVADVNINQDNDLIRDRSFGGDPTFVSSLATAWLRGADAARVLSVAKHFPGHGSTNEGIERPREIPVSSHRSDQLAQALEPFRALAKGGVAAVMTSHMRLENIPSLRGNVTFDEAVFSLLRRRESKISDIEPIDFAGVAVTDDLCLPSVAHGTGREYVGAVAENVRRAFMAGHDLLMIAHVDATKAPVADYDPVGQRKGLTLDEFDRVKADFEHYVFDETTNDHDRRVGRFREALARVLALKEKLAANLAGLPDADERSSRLEAVRIEHARASDGLFRATFATLPQGGPCPSFQLGKKDRLLIVFPVHWVQGGIAKAKLDGTYSSRLDEERGPRGWELLRAFDAAFGQRAKVFVELEEELPQAENYERRAREISALVRRERPRVVLFAISNTYHAEQLATILAHLDPLPDFDLDQVAVIVTGQPNVLSALTRTRLARDLASKVTYFFVYAGWRNSVERADQLFVDALASLKPGQCLGSGNSPPIYIPLLNDTPDWSLRP
ncbi:MAG TPA: glycoside hydrolase family 3 N-terminal domain-containing protein [Thermoanaerobaculia bacterium]|nr:glycoside hydrolase family 3 N-terminal domain-containing protein [Thermoanaerobaculia bacterium]